MLISLQMARFPDHLKLFARALRHKAGTNERALWRLLRDRRLRGVKFRPRVPMGRYIVDFINFPHRLIVEANGPAHEDGAYDRERDAWLIADGYRVLRFANQLIEKDPQGVVDAIVAAVGQGQDAAAPLPAASQPPSPASGEGIDCRP